MDEPALYSSRILDPYIKLLRRRYPQVGIEDILVNSDILPFEVEDENHWFTQRQVDRFYEEVAQATGNPRIAREAGRFAASADTLGLIRSVIASLMGPGRGFDAIGKYAPYFTRSAEYSSLKLGKNSLRVTVRQKEGVDEKPFQCENRIGIFEGVSSIFTSAMAKVTHPECMFRGAPVCVYEISWRPTRADLWRTISHFSAAGCLTLFGLTLIIKPWIALSIMAPVFSALFVTVATYALMLERKESSKAIESLRESTEKLIEKANADTNNAIMLHELGASLSKKLDLTSILAETVRIFEKRLPYDRGVIMLANDEKTLLQYRTGFGHNETNKRFLDNISFHLDRPGSKGVFVVSFREQRPFLINDVTEIKDKLSSFSLEVARFLGAKAFMCVPIVYEKQSLGILAVDNVSTHRPLMQTDVSLIMGIASQLGISIHNAFMIETKERHFKGIIEVLAASIDARDFLTSGHSKRVTGYVVAICEELGLTRDFTEMMRVASLLHDYGKIAVSDKVLKKPGRLTNEEYNEIKTHAEKTREILCQIQFDGIYKDIPEIVGAHHERIDGTGYPRGLKGDDIPLGAKIIAVADYFEAITSQRHYRDPMTIQDAFATLRGISGKHLDTDLVQALITYYCRVNRINADNPQPTAQRAEPPQSTLFN